VVTAGIELWAESNIKHPSILIYLSYLSVIAKRVQSILLRSLLRPEVCKSCC